MRNNAGPTGARRVRCPSFHAHTSAGWRYFPSAAAILSLLPERNAPGLTTLFRPDFPHRPANAVQQGGVLRWSTIKLGLADVQATYESLASPKHLD